MIREHTIDTDTGRNDMDAVALFSCKNVKYRQILFIETLSIFAGHVTCIAGESGGGKTTLLKLFNKLISPTEGIIAFKGIDLSDIDSVQHRKNVVLLSQKPFMFEGTVKDNLLRGAIYHGLSLEDQALLSALERVKLNQALDKDASTLSGGEAQRLALARVMLLNTEVILLDEPSSALDEDTERLVIDEIVAHVRQTGKSLIMVTHASHVARKYADIIYTIEKGTLTGRVENGN
jgi:putative ABC transport system ATP-binding protein